MLYFYICHTTKKQTEKEGFDLKKITLLFFVTYVISIAGCSNSLNRSDINTSDYQGEELVIGIVGDVPDTENPMITYEKLTLENFDKDEQLDGLIFNNKHMFQDLSYSKYTTIFQEMNIPVFFVGLNKPFYVFLQEDLNYDKTPDNETFAKVQGFVFDENKNRTTWEIHAEENTYNSVSTYNNIFNIMNDYNKLAE